MELHSRKTMQRIRLSVCLGCGMEVLTESLRHLHPRSSHFSVGSLLYCSSAMFGLVVDKISLRIAPCRCLLRC